MDSNFIRLLNVIRSLLGAFLISKRGEVAISYFAKDFIFLLLRYTPYKNFFVDYKLAPEIRHRFPSILAFFLV